MNRINVLCLAALAVWATLGGCRNEQREPARAPVEAGPPILLFAADGLEWDVALPLIREGRLPTLARLMDEGTFGLFETIAPTMSPIIWTSVATGKSPDKHGILGFTYKQEGEPGKEPHLYTNGDRITKAFWNILSDYGQTVATLGWWMTFPAEPINGIMVAQTNTPGQAQTARGQNIWKGGLIEGVPGQVYPPERQEEMLSVWAQSDTDLSAHVEQVFGVFKYPMQNLAARMWENCRWALRADFTYFRIAEKLIGSPNPPNVLAVYMGGTDVVSHRFWRYRYPGPFDHKPSDEEMEDYAHLIGDYYAYADQCLGELIAAYEVQPTVIVVSDHGFIPIQTDMYFDPELIPSKVNSGGHPSTVKPAGVVIMSGPRIRKTPLPNPVPELRRVDLARVCSVLDVTPTLLALAGIPVGEDMDGTPVVGAIESDWLTEHPIRRVRTHDTPEWLEARPKTGLESPNKNERLEQLRDLGYIQ